MYRRILAPAMVISALTLCACDQPTPVTPLSEGAVPELALQGAAPNKLDVALCAFGTEFTLQPINPYFPLAVGDQWMLAGEEDDVLVELRITVLDETEIVGGVTTRVIEEVEWEDGELLEVSRNFFATAPDGTVCYFGEDVDIYEDGDISHEGAWRADVAGHFPGILMPAEPRPGIKFLMEGAPGIAEDEGMIVGAGGPIEVEPGTFHETIRVRESSPLDGDWDFKIFARDVGILTDGPLSLVSYTIVAN
jgi:hypothetical protein